MNQEFLHLVEFQGKLVFFIFIKEKKYLSGNEMKEYPLFTPMQQLPERRGVGI